MYWVVRYWWQRRLQGNKGKVSLWRLIGSMVSTSASCCNTLSPCFCLSLVTWLVIIREDIFTLEMWMALSVWHSNFFFCLCGSSHSHDICIKARQLPGNNDQSTHKCLAVYSPFLFPFLSVFRSPSCSRSASRRLSFSTSPLSFT